jgi:hypothetical protein
MKAVVANQDIALISRSMVRQGHWLEPQIASSELTKRLQISKPAFTDSFISERFRTTLKSVHLGVVKWHHPCFGSMKRKFDSCHRDHIVIAFARFRFSSGALQKELAVLSR